ncbi:MAG TPA: glutamine-hydrolyzing carbamoyl-phosphate synthase small subunit [Pirellulales bacterium]|nr:glutamine-hydrolyzing carbamoyl-phosphate synthase small subunit [Pirellulales bacterium]
MPQIAKLALEDGAVFTGTAFGAAGEVDGEVCFNTSMTGYQEILTDPSYRGQIVCMTYPEIGNYGVNPEDVESPNPQLAGFIVRQWSRRESNFRSVGRLHEYLERHGIPGIAEIDTRALVRRLRSSGAMKGVLSSRDLDDARLVAKAKASPGLVGRDLVREVIPDQPRTWNEKLHELARLHCNGGSNGHSHGPSASKAGAAALATADLHVVALDYGMKWNILRHLADMGCRVTVLPGTATADDVLAHKPAGVFLSNGPGDPEPLDYAISTIRGVLGRVPVFGICLGHQLLSLACGAKTFKLKFGHRGANQPVQNLETGKVEITSQNHGFAVAEDTLPAELEITHRNLNDHTIEGLRHRTLPAFCVQYHPEASAGPHDSAYLFAHFKQLMLDGNDQ